MTLALGLIVGCGGDAHQPASSPKSQEQPPAPPQRPATATDASSRARKASPPNGAASKSAASKLTASESSQDSSALANAASGKAPRRGLTELVQPGQAFVEGGTAVPALPPEDDSKKTAFPRRRSAPTSAPEVDAERAAAAGLRKLESRHLVLFTDLPAAPEIDELPRVFDLAVPQWAAYFEIPIDKFRDWRIVGALIQAPERFVRGGLLPPGLPPFKQGYQSDFQVWLYEQPTAYYRRHLLLHEGTHAVMNTLLGGSGPPWFAEGCAELLATHHWRDERLELRVMPDRRENFPGWGRLKILQDDFAAGKGKRLEEVMKYGPTAHLEVEPYGWCWGACWFLDSHPQSQAAFRALRGEVEDGSLDFSRRFYQTLRADWGILTEDWQLFLANADFAYDLERNLVVHRPASQPLPDAGATVKIAVNRGWQSTGYSLDAAKGYSFAARGRFTIVGGAEPWPCEPGGVTLRYNRGWPLGLLLGSVRPEVIPSDKLTPLATPDELGLVRRAIMERAGTLYLRVNDAPGELADNEGEVEVEIRPVKIGGN